MFSIIIPLYNKSNYIEKCLESVVKQSFLYFEVIIVNDGSTDDGPSKICQYIDSLAETKSKIKFINQPNSGVSAARNNGVKMAKYDYIAFLDADDWWEPTFLEEMKNLLKAFPEAGIYGSGYFIVKNSRKRVASIGVESPFTKGIIDYFQVYSKILCMPLTSSSIVISKEIFESENGFKPALKLGEDFDLWIRVALKYPVAFLNKSLANYNQDVALLTRSVGNLHKPQNHMLWNLDYLEKEELKSSDLKKLLDNLRVYGLFPYFISKTYHKSAKSQLGKVDWSKQPSLIKWKYKMPVWLLRAWSKYMYTGSMVKQEFIKVIYKS